MPGTDTAIRHSIPTCRFTAPSVVTLHPRTDEGGPSFLSRIEPSLADAALQPVALLVFGSADAGREALAAYDAAAAQIERVGDQLVGDVAEARAFQQVLGRDARGRAHPAAGS